MSGNVQELRRAALAAHARADFELAAEVFRRILMAYPGTLEAREAVVYLTEGRRLSSETIRVPEPVDAPNAPEP